VIRTRGLRAWAAEAKDRQTLLAGSSPQVMWICSGVPSAGFDYDCPSKSRADAPLKRPDRPAPITNARLDMPPAADALRFFATNSSLSLTSWWLSSNCHMRTAHERRGLVRAS